MTRYDGDAAAFAAAWTEAWNAHDLEAVLAHWAEDCVFVSPVTGRVIGRSTVVGKAALRDYWSRALSRAPDLRFELDTVHEGVESLVSAYRNHRGERCAEMLRFDGEGRAIEGRAHYGK